MAGKHNCFDAVAQEPAEVQYDHFMRRYDEVGGQGRAGRNQVAGAFRPILCECGDRAADRDGHLGWRRRVRTDGG